MSTHARRETYAHLKHTEIHRRAPTGTLHWLRDLASGGEAQIDRRELADRLLVEGDAEPGAGRQSG